MNETPSIQPGLYQHYKGGLYKVLDIARHSETGEFMVVYESQKSDQKLWVRPYKMFTENVTAEGKKIPRFKFLS
jgi:hypothetical protein